MVGYYPARDGYPSMFDLEDSSEADTNAPILSAAPRGQYADSQPNPPFEKLLDLLKLPSH